MSRIKGLNDRNTLKRKPPQAAITVWKGEKKSSTRAGQSLENLFRIEAPAKLKQVIEQACNATEKNGNGSLYVDRLNLVPAFEDESKAFDSKMAAYNASRPILFCDRDRINTKFIEQKDPFGNIYFQPWQSDDPCPVAGTNFECPKGCSRTGDFYFYIYELLLQGYSEFARLQVHGVADNQNIASVLDETKASIGAIKNSPFVSEQTRTYIIYEMTRSRSTYKYPIKQGGIRTAKRGTKEDWIVSLALHPIWLNKYNYHLSHHKLIESGITPSLKLIEQIHDRSLVSSGDNTPLLSAENLSTVEATGTTVLESDRLKEISAIWRAYNWHKQEIATLLFSYFDVSDRAGLMALDNSQFERLKQLSKDESVKREISEEMLN